MNKTITILLVLLSACTIGFFVTPTIFILTPVEDYYSFVVLDLWDETINYGNLIIPAVVLLYLSLPIFSLISRKKTGRLILFLSIYMLLVIAASLLLWGWLLMAIEENTNPERLYNPALGIYLPPFAAVVSAATIILVIIRLRKQKMASY